jgi:hypothetical protein
MKSPEMSSQEKKNDNPISRVESNPLVDQLKKDLKFSYWDFQAKNGINASVVDFANDPSFAKRLGEAKQAGLSMEEMGTAVDFMRNTYGKKAVAQQDGVKIPVQQKVNVVEPVDNEANSVEINNRSHQQDKLTPSSEVDSLRLETEGEATDRIKALDAKYSVVKPVESEERSSYINKAPANDSVFELPKDQQNIEEGVVEPNSSIVQDSVTNLDIPQEKPGFLKTAEEKVRERAEKKQQDAELARIDVGENTLSEQPEKVQEKKDDIPKAAEVAIPSVDEGAVLQENTTNQKVESVEQMEQSEPVFSPEIKKSFEDVIESNVRLLQKLEERERDGLNYLLEQSAAFQYGSALARIRDNQKLDEALRKDINKAAEAMSEFGVSQESRLSEDVDSLGRLDDILSNVSQDMVSFGKKLRDTYGDKAEPHVHALVRLIDNLDLASQRLRSRKFRVQDYLDR